jgi:cytosine/uracil/thiamine/allantoin permease
VRRTHLDLDALYAEGSEYAYGGSGVNRAAVWAAAAGIAVSLSGLLVPRLVFLFEGAWFSATFVSAFAYWLLMRGRRGAPPT